MKCHYDVLEVTRDASADDIKKAYRKRALQWHPDKHQDNKEEANKQFLLIQDAYETLSNDQDRAWYDSHREVLINGGVPGEAGEANYTFNIYAYFSSSCFSGFNDSEKGFYTVYANMFAKITEEDEPFYDKDVKVPYFGESTSDYDEVVGPFYAFWLSYCSPRSFVWCEKHDTRDGGDRFVRRQMEKENKKLKDKAKKERNEEIRKIVAQVRKRDPRMETYRKLLEEKSALAHKKSLEKKENDRLRRLEQMKNYVEPEWSAVESKIKELELEDEKINRNRNAAFKSPSPSGDNDESLNDETSGGATASASAAPEVVDYDSEYSDDNELFCVACNKSFKSAKSFVNHENSKKHKENLEFIKRQMKEEDSILFAGAKDEDKSDEEDETENVSNSMGKNETKNKMSKKQKKKHKNKNKALLEENSDIEESGELDVAEVKIEESPIIDSEPIETKENDPEQPEQPTDVTETVEIIKPNVCTVCLKGFDTRDELIEHIKAEGHSKPAAVKKVSESSAKVPEEPSVCNICRKEFDTRNKLFDHIKKEGHASIKQMASEKQDPLSHNQAKRNKLAAKSKKQNTSF